MSHEPHDPNRERWRATTRAAASKGTPDRRERFLTSSGTEIRDVYTAADLAGLDEAADLGLPGEFPFTRGVQPTMYRGRLWTMRQYAGFATAAETNERFRYLLEQGQTGLSVAFDLPTQMGFDSDAPEAAGEVGRVGVPISSLADMETLFQGIPLDRVSTSMTINSTAAILLALYVAAAERQGAPRSALSGTTQNDILKEYIARGTWIYPPRPSMRLVTDIFEFSSRELPRWNTISISGYHMREAGATAAQELAFTLADAIAYVEAATARGLDVDDFAGRLSFFFASWSELFEEVAKFRAARRMWARIMRDRFGSHNPRSQMCRFHVQTAGSSLTAQSIDNNVVRTTVQALAAILGGAQSLHTNARDEALALPTAEAARLALRTQQILANEAGVTETPDPLGGSYYVEIPDRRRRARRARLPGRDRGPGRHPRGPRGRLPAAPDPGGRLPGPDGDRAGRPGRRRRQQVPRRAGPDPTDPEDRSGRRAPPGRRPAPRPVRARSGCLGGGPRAPRVGRPGKRQPPAADDRGGQGLRHRGRDQRPAADGVGRAPRADHDLNAQPPGARPMTQPPTLPARLHRIGRIHHVALVVRDLEASLAFYREILGLEVTTIEEIAHDRVRIAFLPIGASSIELVQPTDATTGVARFLATKGEGFHHVCLEVANLSESLTRLAIDGIELIDTAPRRGADGPVAFLHPRSCGGVLIELIEAPGGPSWAALGY